MYKYTEWQYNVVVFVLSVAVFYNGAKYVDRISFYSCFTAGCVLKVYSWAIHLYIL